MLVLSRKAGESITIGGSSEGCLITVLQVMPEENAIKMLIGHASATRAEILESRTYEVARDVTVRLSDAISVTLIDVREDKARLGIDAPKEGPVHRLEVYEAIRREYRRDEDGGMAGSRVPRPPSPKPPSLDVRLEEPRPEDEGK